MKMPRWKIHLILSLFLVVAWMSLLNFANFRLSPPDIIFLLTFVTFASLFPDVDMNRSKIRDVFSLSIAAAVSAVYLFLFPSIWYYAFVYFVILYFILRYIPTKHRGVTHSLRFSILFSLALAAVYFIFNVFLFEKFVLWFVIVFSSYNLHLAVEKT